MERMAIRLRRPHRPSEPVVIRRIGAVAFDFKLGPMVEMMHRGDYAPELTSLLPRLLRRGDVVVDVGANIGYIAAVALSAVGREGEVHAFEPVTRHFERLERLHALNRDW